MDARDLSTECSQCSTTLISRYQDNHNQATKEPNADFLQTPKLSSVRAEVTVSMRRETLSLAVSVAVS